MLLKINIHNAKILQKNKNEDTEKNYFNLFPSLH